MENTMNNTMNKEKLVEIKINKRVWKETKEQALKMTLGTITILALYFLMESFVAMVEQWSISGTPLIVNLICLAWLGLFTTYLFIVNR